MPTAYSAGMWDSADDPGRATNRRGSGHFAIANVQFRNGSFTRITRSGAISLSSCTIPEGHRISIRLADAARPSPKCMGTARDDAYPAANETWLYCTRPPAVTWIRAPIPSRLLVFPSSFRSNQCAAPGLSFNHNSAGALKVVVNNVQAAVAIQVAVDVQRGEFHIRRSSLGSSMTSESWPTSFTSKSRLLAMRQYA